MSVELSNTSIGGSTASDSGPATLQMASIGYVIDLIEDTSKISPHILSFLKNVKVGYKEQETGPQTAYAKFGKNYFPNAENIKFKEDYDISMFPKMKQPEPIQPCGPTAKPLIELVADSKLPPTVLIHIGDEEMYCNWEILKLFSEYFDNLPYTGEQRLPETLCTMHEFKELYSFLIHEKKSIKTSEMFAILKTCNSLGVSNLKTRLLAHMENVGHFYEYQLFSLYLHARDVDGFVEWKQQYLWTIGKSFAFVVMSQEFVEMPFQDLENLLKTPKPIANDETEVFYAVVRWLNYKWYERQPYMHRLLKNVRWAFMRPSNVKMLMEPQVDIEVERITADPEVKQQIMFTFAYLALTGGDCTVEKHVIAESLYYFVPANRKWIMDPSCPYHHDLCCVNSWKDSFTYQAYIAFLKQLQKFSQAGEHLKYISLVKNLKESKGLGCSNPKCGANFIAWNDAYDVRE